jgi:hypothetical protein
MMSGQEHGDGYSLKEEPRKAKDPAKISERICETEKKGKKQIRFPLISDNSEIVRFS